MSIWKGEKKKNKKEPTIPRDAKKLPQRKRVVPLRASQESRRQLVCFSSRTLRNLRNFSLSLHAQQPLQLFDSPHPHCTPGYKP